MAASGGKATGCRRPERSPDRAGVDRAPLAPLPEHAARAAIATHAIDGLSLLTVRRVSGYDVPSNNVAAEENQPPVPLTHAIFASGT